MFPDLFSCINQRWTCISPANRSIQSSSYPIPTNPIFPPLPLLPRPTAHLLWAITTAPHSLCPLQQFTTWQQSKLPLQLWSYYIHFTSSCDSHHLLGWRKEHQPDFPALHHLELLLLHSPFIYSLHPVPPLPLCSSHLDIFLFLCLSIHALLWFQLSHKCAPTTVPLLLFHLTNSYYPSNLNWNSIASWRTSWPLRQGPLFLLHIPQSTEHALL